MGIGDNDIEILFLDNLNRAVIVDRRFNSMTFVGEKEREALSNILVSIYYQEMTHGINANAKE